MVVSKPDKPEEAIKSQPGYTELVSPGGFVTSVPDSIKDILIDSGYTE